MRRFLICVLLAFEGCTPTGDDQPVSKVIQPTPPPEAPPTGLPANVQAYIASQLPDRAIVSKEDYARSFWSFYDTGTQPFFTAADLNDDGLVDYGVLVKKGGFVELALLIGIGSSFRFELAGSFKKAFDDTANDLGWCLLPEPPGQIDVAYPSIQSLILVSNGINLMYLENRIGIYYWDEEGIGLFPKR